jgi:uncharacterized membrane protein YkvA (DUF1232 family)
MLANFRERIRQLKQDVFALYFAVRHPNTPWYAKLFVACIVAYALSPIDLIPDFIPVLGYLDDLVLVPLGIALAIKLIPSDILDECRSLALHSTSPGAPPNFVAGGIIVLVWITLALIGIYWCYWHFAH